MVSALPMVATAVVSLAGGASVGVYTSDVSRRICNLVHLHTCVHVDLVKFSDRTFRIHYGNDFPFEIIKFSSNLALSALLTKVTHVALSLISPFAAGYFAFGLMTASIIHSCIPLLTYLTSGKTEYLGIELNKDEIASIPKDAHIKIYPKRSDPHTKIMNGDTLFSRIFTSDWKWAENA